MRRSWQGAAAAIATTSSATVSCSRLSTSAGFGGRVMDDSRPKYLNTDDTPVFKKSRNLFSLNFAKGEADGRLILAEGYMT